MFSLLGNNTQVCELDASHAARIARLEAAYFPTPWSEKQVATGLASERYHISGVLAGGEVLGYLAWFTAADEAEIVNLLVVPAARRQGLGRCILTHVLQSCHVKGIRYLYLEVRETNAPAIALYASCGFARCGVRPQYYPDTLEAAVLMRCDMASFWSSNPGITAVPHDPLQGVSMRFLSDIDITERRVLIRVDFNVPIKDGTITDDLRIRAALDTIRHCVDNNARVVLMSHMGKPKGQVVPSLSLAPAARRLGELLDMDIAMAPDCVGEEAERMASALKPGEVLMLENLRFHDGETSNDPEFSKGLAVMGDVYVDDAFGVAHRAHASVVGVTRYFDTCCAGMLLQKEWEFIGQALSDPARPYVAISGGAKVSSKLGVLRRLLTKVDAIIIGGAMANTFMLAMGHSMGTSLTEPDLVDEAKDIMREAEERGVKLHLPVDYVAGTDPNVQTSSGVYTPDNFPDNRMALDIGPESAVAFAEALQGARTVMWNGPMGLFENTAYAQGTLALARAVAKLPDATTIIGGGDTDAALHMAGHANDVTFVSTGGGSFLEFLEGKELPAFAALKECNT